MPVYEYQCEKCGHRVEIIQKFSDPPLTECPKCKGSLSKVFAPSALQFKGSGWYITDYSQKGKPSKDEAKADSPKPEKSEVKDKTETKPASEKAGEKSSSESKTSSETKESSPKK